MTAPDSRPVLDVIADAIHEAECTAYRHEGRNAQCQRIARVVLAACQGATVEQQAELTGGRVEHAPLKRLSSDDLGRRFAWVHCSRVVTEWREDPS